MTFEQYCAIIKDSVRHQGFESFYPSLCLPDDPEEKVMVLDGRFGIDGDEVVAKEWAARFDSAVKYLAYRSTNRSVIICHIIDNDVKAKLQLVVEPA
jgi:hypothetical protein